MKFLKGDVVTIKRSDGSGLFWNNSTVTGVDDEREYPVFVSNPAGSLGAFKHEGLTLVERTTKELTKREAGIIRIAWDLCKLMDDEWPTGSKLYLKEATRIYDREVNLFKQGVK